MYKAKYKKNLTAFPDESLSGDVVGYLKLTNTVGDIFFLTKLKGKVVILDFWFTGYVGCIQTTPALKVVGEKLKVDTNVVFVK